MGEQRNKRDIVVNKLRACFSLNNRFHSDEAFERYINTKPCSSLRHRKFNLTDAHANKHSTVVSLSSEVEVSTWLIFLADTSALHLLQLVRSSFEKDVNQTNHALPNSNDSNPE
jgi:hypothetical protein